MSHRLKRHISMKHTFLALVLSTSLVLPVSGTVTAYAAGYDAEEDTEEPLDFDEEAPASKTHKAKMAAGLVAVLAVAAGIWAYYPKGKVKGNRQKEGKSQAFNQDGQPVDLEGNEVEDMFEHKGQTTSRR
jgi:hypothetical protein